MIPTAVIFDLDGTLIDSTGDIADAVAAARRAWGHPALPDEEVARHIGWGLGHLLAHTLPGLSEVEVARARELFIEAYGARPLARTRPYEGAEAALGALEARGIPMALVTNKPGMFLAPILQGLGWAERFQAVYGGDALPARKPDPLPLLTAVEALGVPVESTLYVGDTEVDAETARRAGVTFRCVPWGRAAAESETIGLEALVSWVEGR